MGSLQWNGIAPAMTPGKYNNTGAIYLSHA
jgi:hypothetical protein